MPTVGVKLHSQSGVKDYADLMFSTIGLVEGSYDLVDKFCLIRVLQNQTIGSPNPWNPNCTGYVTIGQSDRNVSYSVEYATIVGNANSYFIYCRLT